MKAEFTARHCLTHDHQPLAMQENTITLADEALRHVLTAANLGGQLEKRGLLATRKEVAHG